MKREILVGALLFSLAQPVMGLAATSDVQAAAEMSSAPMHEMQSREVEGQPYTLNPGDKLSILVLQDEKISTASNGSNAYTVRLDGTISLPYLGQLNVKGMTVGELTEELTQALAKYYVNPDVTINVLEPAGVRVYVLGEFNKTGYVDLTRGHKVIDAVGAAGSFTLDAAKKRLILIHNDGSNTMIPVNLNKMITTGDLAENYELQEGDILYLTRNHRITFARDIAPLIASAYNISKIDK